MMTNTETEHALVSSAQEGDRQAFGELVSLYRQGVINVVYRICGDEALAEDIAQEAFIRAWQKLPSYQPKASFRSWVYRIATNAVLDELRRQKETINVDGLQVADPAQSIEERLIDRQEVERVQAAILDLPEASRAVLVLREFEGLSYQEIADALDIPKGTVMSRLNYARKSMRNALAEFAALDQAVEVI